jgi:hypothetical protein
MNYRLLVSMFLTLCLTGCGGGGSGVSTVSEPVPAPASRPQVETLKASAEIGGSYDTPYRTDADSPDGFLYVTTPYALLQVAKETGSVRTLAGYNNDVYSPTSVYLSGQNIYSGDYSGRIFGVFTGTDGFTGTDLLYNGHLPGTLNTGNIFGNSSALFYMGDDAVYSVPYGDYHNPTSVTTYPAATSTIAVTENEIFFSTYTMSIFRFDLRSHQMQLVKSGVQNQSGNGAEAPVMIWHAPYLYWVDGRNLDRYNTLTSQVERVATALPPYVSMLAADDATVYANAAYGSPPMLDKVDLASGQVFEICPSSLIQGIAAGDGAAYFVTGNDIYQIMGNDPPRRILAGAEFNVGGVQRGGFAYDHGFLFMNTMLSSGEKMLVHELATEKTMVYSPTNPVESFFYHDGALYAYTRSGSGALTRTPLDKPLRKLVQFSPSDATPGTVISLVGDENYLYWMYKGRYGGAFKVMRVAKGSPGAVEGLFQSASELRDLAVHGGRLYFSCLNSCGRPGWVMASLALDGGPVRAEVPLADEPKSFYLNGNFYVADTADHQSRSLYLVDVERAAAKLLLRGLPYSSDPTMKDVTVRASSKWLYIGAALGYYRGKISRYPIQSGGTVGSEEVIVDRPAGDVLSLMPTSISTDGAYLYFWDGALKRVAE